MNATTASKTVMLTNNQIIPLSISGISAPNNFAATSSCPLAPNTLAARSSCSIQVTFTPTKVGPLGGTLIVNDNAPNTPQTVALSGTGTNPATLTPASLSFAGQAITVDGGMIAR